MVKQYNSSESNVLDRNGVNLIFDYLEFPTQECLDDLLDYFPYVSEGRDTNQSSNLEYEIKFGLLNILNSSLYEWRDGTISLLFDQEKGDDLARHRYLDLVEEVSVDLLVSERSEEYKYSNLETLRSLYMRTSTIPHTQDRTLRSETYEVLENYLNGFLERVLDRSEEGLSKYDYFTGEQISIDSDCLRTRILFSEILPYLSERDTELASERLQELLEIQQAYPRFYGN